MSSGGTSNLYQRNINSGNSNKNTIYEFDRFRLEAAHRMLYENDLPVQLAPKVVETLIALVERRGEIVSKNELMNLLWADSFVEESNLTQNIYLLRKTLGKDAGGRDLVEGFRRRGYRFTGEIKPAAETEYEAHGSDPVPCEIEPPTPERLRRAGSPPDNDKQTESVTGINEAHTAQAYGAADDAAKITDTKNRHQAERIAPEKSKRLSPIVLLTGLLLLAAVGFGVWFTIGRGANSKQIESIAVLPFTNESGNADAEYLSDGMTESLIGSLSQIPNLNVKARSSVFRYKGKDTSARTVGKELNVQAVLSGRVVQRGDDLTLYLSLVDASSENNIWSRQYNRKLTNLVALQTEIAHDVADNLRAKLSGADEKRLAKNYTENAEAYRFYLQGRYFWNKRTENDIYKSLEFYEKAIALDSNYALAYAGLADSYCNLSFGGYASMPPVVSFPRAKEAAQRALAIDDTLAEAYVPLAFVADRHEWNFAAAENFYKRAIELKPDYATAHHRYGLFLGQLGRFDESIAEFERARALDPLSMIIASDSSLPYFWLRRYEKAIEILQNALEIDPNFSRAYLLLASNYQELGRFEEAYAAGRKNYELSGGQYSKDGFKRVNIPLAVAYAAAGRREEVLKMLAEADAEVKKGSYYMPQFRAVIYTKLGGKDQAFEWLERAYADRLPGLVELKVNPSWDNLRDDPRFRDLLRRMNFPP